MRHLTTILFALLIATQASAAEWGTQGGATLGRGAALNLDFISAIATYDYGYRRVTYGGTVYGTIALRPNLDLVMGGSIFDAGTSLNFGVRGRVFRLGHFHLALELDASGAFYLAGEDGFGGGVNVILQGGLLASYFFADGFEVFGGVVSAFDPLAIRAAAIAPADIIDGRIRLGIAYDIAHSPAALFAQVEVGAGYHTSEVLLDNDTFYVGTETLSPLHPVINAVIGLQLGFSANR